MNLPVDRKTLPSLHEASNLDQIEALVLEKLGLDPNSYAVQAEAAVTTRGVVIKGLTIRYVGE